MIRPKNKKAQEGVIVTVLLILIAILALAVVSIFVMKNVKNTSSLSDDKANCMKVNFELTDAKIFTNSSGANLAQVSIIRKDASNISLRGFRVSKNDRFIEEITTGLPLILETVPVKTINTAVSGDKIRLNAILSTGYTCEEGQEIIIP